MAITTWTELKSAVATWSNRSDLTTQIPDFIALAEARLYDLLVLKDMESEESLTLTQDQNYVAIPTGFVSDIALWLVVDGERILLTKVQPEQLPYYSESSRPRFWAIDGTNIRFDFPADQAYTAKFRMLKKSNLSGSVASNYLLAKRPDIYLAASLAELARYTRDVELLNVWEPKLTSAVKALQASESRSRRAPLRSDVPLMRRVVNIFTGD